MDTDSEDAEMMSLAEAYDYSSRTGKNLHLKRWADGSLLTVWK